MKKNRQALLPGWGLLAAVALGAATLAAPGEQKTSGSDDVRAYLEILRSDFNTSKIATINEVMRLTGPEAEKFWPVYRKYEQDLAAVGDRKLALIERFGELHFGGRLDDRAARELAEAWLENTQQRLNLWKKYHREISRAVSPMRGAQFLQIENQLALFVDMAVASEMPAVGSK